MHYGLQQVVAPASEPVTLAMAKNHLNLDQSFTIDDDLIIAYTAAGREYAERYTNRVFIEQTLVMSLDHFPWHTASQGTGRSSFTPAYAQFAPLYDTYAVRGMQINLPRSPVIAVQSITYLDDTLQSQTVPSNQYLVDTSSEPARIIPVPGAIWPYQLNYVPGSVQITFLVGFSRNVTETLTVTNGQAAPSQLATAVPTVKYTNGTALVLVATNPTQGQFSYANGIVTVNVADEGASIVLSYRTPNVPNTIQQAIKLMIGSWYMTRQGVSSLNLKNVPLGINALLSCNRLFLFTVGN